MSFAFRFIPFIFALMVFTFSPSAFACNPKDGANCRGFPCAVQQLGTTMLDHDKEHIIACLKSPYKTSSGGDLYMWKTTSNEMGTDTWVNVSLSDTNNFDTNCQYRIYFDHGGMFPSGYLPTISVHHDMLLTAVSSHQFALGKVKSTAKGWWFYTASGNAAVDHCFWTVNKFTDYVDAAGNKLFNCEDSLLKVKAIMKQCASAYYYPP